MPVYNKEVLLIDDDDDLRLLVAKVLETAGLVVRQCANILDGMNLARERIPHLIVLDLSFANGETGFDFLEARRQVPLLKNVPILVLSSHAEEAMIFKAISFGALDYIMKPLNAPVLLQKVRKTLHLATALTSVVFEPSQRPKARIFVPGRLKKVGEAGVLMEAPVKVVDPAEATTRKIGIKAPILDEMGVNKHFLVPNSMEKQSIPALTGPGQYWTELSLVGLEENTAFRMRKVFKEWQ